MVDRLTLPVKSLVVNSCLTACLVGGITAYVQNRPFFDTAVKIAACAFGMSLASKWIHNDYILPICQKYNWNETTCDLIGASFSTALESGAVIGAYASGFFSAPMATGIAISEILGTSLSVLTFIRDHDTVRDKPATDLN